MDALASACASRYKETSADVAEQVDARDLKSLASGRAGSIPAVRTIPLSGLLSGQVCSAFRSGLNAQKQTARHLFRAGRCICAR